MEGDKFPIGLRVLVVDDDHTSLINLEEILMKCKYRVTVATETVTALRMLRENRDMFDIVITDVNMPHMDGFKLLELIGFEMDIPVLLLSEDDDPELVMRGVRHGAVDFLSKPARMDQIKYIWQHVIRRKQCKQKVNPNSGSDGGSNTLSIDGDGNSNPEETILKKRKEQSSGDDEDEDEGRDENEGEDEDSNPKKKPRVVWHPDLHQKFVAAVDHLGPEKALPKKILDFMNVEGLTRENVASHLQKYRLYLKRLNPSSNQSSIQGSSIYMNGVVKSSLGQMNGYCSDLYTNSNNRAVSWLSSTTSSNPRAGVPSLEDYTRFMENWKTRPNDEQNMLEMNQLPLSSFNGGFGCDNDISYPFVGVSEVESQGWQPQRNEPENISTIYNNTMIDPSYNADIGLMQSTEIQDNDFDALLRLDDSYLLDDSTDLLAGFTLNNCGTLDDLLGGFAKEI